MSRILVTGGAGYIGSHVAKVLVEAGHTLAVVDNLSTGHRATVSNLAALGGSNFSFFEVDVCDTDDIEAVCRRFAPEVIVHLAGLKCVEDSFDRPRAYHRCNVGGTQSLLGAAAASGCKRVIYSSTAAVYGDSEDVPFLEELPARPVSPYGQTKAIAEQLVRAWSDSAADRRTALVLRYFNPCGRAPCLAIPSSVGASGVNSLADRVVRVAAGVEPRLAIFGNTYATVDGTCRRDFVHIQDIAEAHLCAVRFTETATAQFEVFNLGSGEDTSVLEFLQTYRETTGIEIPFSFGPARKGDLPVSWAHIAKAETLMGWRPRYGIREICRDLKPKRYPAGYFAADPERPPAPPQRSLVPG